MGSANVQRAIEFAAPGGVALYGDLYRPQGGGPHPVLVGMPGGGWTRGDRSALQHWGHYLAEHGIALFSIDYRRATQGKVFPHNAQDVAAALAFVADQAQQLGVDAERIGLLGASAGAQLGALVALAGERPFIAEAVPRLPAIRVLVGVYGPYDLVDLWQADLGSNPAAEQQPVVRLLGATPYDDQQLYFDASPIRHVSYRKNALKTLLVWGTQDLDVPERQSIAFAAALRQARFLVRTIQVAGAGHFWFSEDPIDDPRGFTWAIAPRVLRFLQQHLAGSTK